MTKYRYILNCFYSKKPALFYLTKFFTTYIDTIFLLSLVCVIIYVLIQNNYCLVLIRVFYLFNSDDGHLRRTL